MLAGLLQLKWEWKLSLQCLPLSQSLWWLQGLCRQQALKLLLLTEAAGPLVKLAGGLAARC